jgi:hypothetical protein
MQVEQDGVQAPSFRLDVPLHSLLTKPVAPVSGLQPVGEPQRFPDPVFPQRPELLGPIVDDAEWQPLFAETDINGLQKTGTPSHELMASLFEAIVLQNLSVLTRGHTLRPHVLLLGGPNGFIQGNARGMASQHSPYVEGAEG